MTFVYRGASALERNEKVDGGECARLIQHFLPQVGQTACWKPGENVIDVLARGGRIEQGTAIATFVNGRYPAQGWRHAAFFLWPNTSCTHDPKTMRCKLISIHVMDQWNDHPGSHYHKDKISSRDIRIYAKNSAYPVSDNASMFYIIER